jgi:hypothetical protein
VKTPYFENGTNYCSLNFDWSLLYVNFAASNKSKQLLMKKILCVAAMALSTMAVKAQTSKGQVMVGGNASFNSSKFEDDDDSKVTMIQLNPNVGYFFIDNLAGGLRLSLQSSKYKGGLDDDAYTEFSASPFLRYYFLPVGQKVNVFADASYGMGSAGGDEKESFNQFAFTAGPAVFLTPNTALELGIGYRSLGGDAFGDKRYNTIGLNIGFQIHLGGK